MRCLIYSRVSTDAQERDGTSLETQERACLEYATAAGWTIVRQIRDAASGYSLDREGMEQIRRGLAQAEFDVVLSFAVDRLSRNQNHIGVLFDEANGYGVKLDFVTEKFEDTAVGRFILAARAFVAEVEREKIVERTQRGKAQRARGGKLPQATGKGIYGYRYIAATGTREIDEHQARVVRRIFETFTQGGSCNRLAIDLNAEAVPAFGGGSWYPLTVRRILQNETYTGRSFFRRTKSEKFRDGRTGKTKIRVTERPENEWIEILGATPPIISVGLFEQAQRILSDPDRRTRAKPSRAYPLTGRLRCASCGGPMVGQVLMKGRYSYYRCRGTYVGRSDSTCSAKYIRTDALESGIRHALLDLLSEPQRILSEVSRIASSEPRSDELQSVLEALKTIEAKQRRLVKLFTDGDLPEEMLDAERTDLSRRRLNLEAERSRFESLAPPAIDLAEVSRTLPAVVRGIREWLAGADVDDLKLMLNAVDARITASPTEAQLNGTLPVFESGVAYDLATIERTSA
jgi:site-specific DNA recombinase